MLKKSFSVLLIGTLLSLSPISAADLSLKEFLKTTDKIEARMEYPSMPKLAANSITNIKLNANTPVMIKCDETITTNDVVNGSTVKFSVLQDVKNNNGVVIIRAGEPVTAQITFAKQRGRIGGSGQLTVSDFHTTAVDGTYVPLSGTVSHNPDDKMALSICLGVFICPLFLLMRGEDAQLPAGTTRTSYTAADIYINATNL